MLQTLTFPAGGRQINAKASFFRYEDGTAGGGDASIRIRADGQDLGLYLPGDQIELPLPATTWEVVPVLAGTVGTVRLGVGRVSSARLVGAVSVVDQSSSKTLAGSEFLGTMTNSTVGQGVNLAGFSATTKRIAVNVFGLSSPTAGKCSMYFGTASPTSGLISIPSGGNNKCIGLAPSTAAAVQAQSAGTTPTTVELPGRGGFGHYFVQADQMLLVRPMRPIIVPAGACLIASGYVADRQIGLLLDFEEI